MEGGKKRERQSIRTKIVIAMAVVFACMFAVLFTVFYTSMRSMLIEREQDNMFNQAQLSENVLMSSVNFIPSVTRDWSSWDLTYDFANGDYDEHIEDNLTEYPFQLYRLDFITVLDDNGDVLYERFYDVNNMEFVDPPADLAEIYEKLSPMTADTFDESEYLDLVDTTQIGMAGFASEDGTVYYMSSYPIIKSDETGPVAGTFIFGRVIDKDEINYLTESSGLDFAVMTKEEAGLPSSGAAVVEEQGELLVAQDGEAVAYESITDIFGDKSLLLSIDRQRTLYEQGMGFITTILAVIAACCGAMLIVVIKVLNNIVIRPLKTLATDVNAINIDTVQTSLKVGGGGREMDGLAFAMNNMLSRIRDDRDTIKKKSEELYYNAHFDFLTGMRNRISAMQELSNAIDGAKEGHNALTVFFIDLDRFKFLNDTFGPTMGDQFILSVARRMQETFSGEALLGRMGGDEFTIVKSGLGKEVDRQMFVERIFDVFKKPFAVREREMHISASVGSSNYPENGQDAETLISNAEMALYRAKEAGDGLYISYKREFHAALQRKIYIENRIRSVIHEGCKEFSAFFQSKVSAETGEIKSAEALIRWIAPEGLISPMEFIPQAEESGLIVPLSWWMIKESMNRTKQFEKHGIVNNIAINISAQVLLHEDFLTVLENASKETGLALDRVDIEITESTLLDDMERVNMVLKKLHGLGAEISVDDFGTGYSSLSYLNKLAVDRIKIDRSFVMGIGEDTENEAIIKAIVAMAKSLGIIVTAEGVETVRQREFLSMAGCDELQGYLFSKPLRSDEYIVFAEQWER